MSTEVALPNLGESVTEGTVTRWLKSTGDTVDVDEPLLEVSTDKVDTEIPSPVGGTVLEIRVQEDDTVEVGTVLCLVGEPAGRGPEIPTADAPQEQVAQVAPVPEAPPAETAPGGTSTDEVMVELPSLGESVTEGTITRWLKSPGDEVAMDEPLLEVSTDKVDTEIPSPIAGTLLRILAEEDQQVPVGTAVAVLASAIPSQPRPAASDSPTTPPEEKVPAGAPDGATESEPVDAVPVVSPAPGPPAPAPAAPVPAAPVVQVPVSAPPAAAAGNEGEFRGSTVKISRLRGLIARRMTESLAVAAQLTQVIEIDLTHVARLREAHKAAFLQREGVKLTYLPFIVKATTEVLQRHPSLNASVDAEAGTITYYDHEHVALAVDTPKGLFTPVIRDAGVLPIGEIARRTADLAARTRANQVSPDELGGGTFTITNIGSFGALFDTPIINQPQVAILGPGAVVKRPVVISDPRLGETIAIRSMAYFSLTYDHRLVDGADAGRFLADLRRTLELADFEV